MENTEIWIVAGAFYFAPLVIALVRRQDNVIAIAIVNVLLGWTIIGWIAALMGAFLKRSDPDAQYPDAAENDAARRGAGGPRPINYR